MCETLCCCVLVTMLFWSAGRHVGLSLHIYRLPSRGTLAARLGHVYAPCRVLLRFHMFGSLWLALRFGFGAIVVTKPYMFYRVRFLRCHLTLLIFRPSCSWARAGHVGSTVSGCCVRENPVSGFCPWILRPCDVEAIMA